jgi:poly-gamma-glutamate synthesis protein (capsule biosynthesis protein)
MAGDILIHSALRDSTKLEGGGYDFKPYWTEIKPYINGDITICNMEGPVDVHGNDADMTTYPQFNTPLEILDSLKFAGFDTLITANNHAYDKGYDGLAATRANIESKGFNVTGTNTSQEQYDEYLILDANGLKVGIIAYSEIDNGLGGLIPSDKRPFAMRRFNVGTADVEKMAADMQACRNAGADMIILSLHWGAEYVNKPTDAMAKMARELAEAGADVVMGNHSHCVQPMEWIDTSRGRRLIIYSLGNFFVDQNALDPPVPKTQYGMIVNVTAELSGGELLVNADYLPTFMRKYRIDGKNTYMLLPAEANPDVAQAAFDHVTSIVGDAVAVFSEQ